MGGWQTARYLLGLSLVIFGVLLITVRPDTEQKHETQSNQHSEEVGTDTVGKQAPANANIRDAGLQGAELWQDTTQRGQVENPLGRSIDPTYDVMTKR